jgi:IS30 family transposase
VEQRLTAEDVAALVEAYKSGATGRELAAQFGLARTTVIELLRKHGVQVRYPRITEQQTMQVVEWYRAGMRQIDIAERLGRHKSVVWHLLRRAGEL